MSDTSTKAMTNTAAPAPTQAPLRPALVVLSDASARPLAGQLHELSGPMLWIGRRPDADIWLPADGVSRRHALLRATEDQAAYRIEDAGSKNGTLLNQQRLAEPQLLQHGDLLQVGPLQLRYLAADDPERLSYQRLHERTRLDAFTGCCNKPHFMERLAQAVERAQLIGRPLSLAVLDIDHFKRLNDAHGHAAGDRMLLAVAECLRAGARDQQGLCGRFGGEEFVLMLPDRDVAALRALAERLRESVQALSVDHDGQRLSVTISVGVAQLSHRTASAEALFERADAALYRAKQGGRNRVCLDGHGDRDSGAKA